MFSGKLCFLAHPSWEKVLHRSALFRSPSLKAKDTFIYNTEPCLAKLSPLLHDIQKAQLDFRVGNLDPIRLLPLSDRVNEFRQHNLHAGARLEAALDDPGIICEVPSGKKAAPGGISMKYEFCSPYVAGNYAHYWACRITASRMLLRLRHLAVLVVYENHDHNKLNPSLLSMTFKDPPSLFLEKECRDLAERICSSVPYTKVRAPFAGIHMIFPLEMALLVSDAERKVWITNELENLLKGLGLKLSLERMEMTADLLTGGIGTWDESRWQPQGFKNE